MDDMQIDEDAGPTELNTSMQGPGLDISKDRLAVRYVGDGRHGNDVGSIQGNRPVPLHQRIFYFEVTITSAVDAPQVTIGFTEKNFKLTRQPGWEPGSYGYMSETGMVYHNSEKGEDYGPKFGSGDVVGAALHLGRQEMFFTKNGTKLKTAFKNVTRVLYPTIGLHSKGAAVVVNFGSKPFEFDLEGLLAEERQQQQQALDSLRLQPADLHSLVHDYLLHYGYASTLNAFEAEAGLGAAAGRSSGSAQQTVLLRQQLRGAVLEGQVQQAVALLQAQCPQLLSSTHPCSAQVQFHLSCLHFIELIRQRRLAEAVAHGQSELTQHRRSFPAGEALVRDVVALIAYEQPESSCLSYLMDPRQRESVADVVNAAVLQATASSSSSSSSDGSGGSSRGKGSGGSSSEEAAAGPSQKDSPPLLPQAASSSCWDTGATSVVERLLVQLTAVQGLLREANANQGEVFQLQRYLGPSLPHSL